MEVKKLMEKRMLRGVSCTQKILFHLKSVSIRAVDTGASDEDVTGRC